MSTQKTLPTDASVDEFLSAVELAVRREDGFELARIFHEVTGVKPVMWGPTMIGYGAFEYVSPRNPRTRGIWPIVAFSPRKAKHSLYGMKDATEGAALLPTLGKYTEGAGCVYVTRLRDIDLDVLRQLIEIAWEAHEDIRDSVDVLAALRS